MSTGIFGFIESFFFLSLAISFVLILLLVYHFKQRISFLEQKVETVVHVMQDYAHELNRIRMQEYMGGGGGGGGVGGMNESTAPEMFANLFMGGCMVPPPFDMNKEESSNVVELDDAVDFRLKEAESDDDEASDSESDSDSEDESPTEPSTAKIVVSDTEPEIIPDTPSLSDYRKMSLSALKQLVVSQKLAVEASKMKKQELVDLLTNSTSQI